MAIRTTCARRFVIAFALACATAVACLLLTPAPRAFALSDPGYSVDSVAVNAEVQTNASIHVVERRTFEIDADCPAVVWRLFDPLPQNATVSVDSMRYVRVNENGIIEGNFTNLSQVQFQTKWRTESEESAALEASHTADGGDATPCFSYDTGRGLMYLFNPGQGQGPTTIEFEIDYTVENGVYAYKDVGEISWKYVNEEWEVPTQNVSMRVSLPIPSGVTVKPYDNVNAWGHGAENGFVSVTTDGAVSYHVQYTNPGQYAEAHIIFPANWLTNLQGEKARVNKETMRGQYVVANEAVWADTARIRALSADRLHIVMGILCLVFVLAAYGISRRYGGEPEPEEPCEQNLLGLAGALAEGGLHPALLSRFRNSGLSSDADIVASVLHLVQDGAIEVRAGGKLLEGGRTIDDYALERIDAVAEKAAEQSAVDSQILELLFTVFGGGKRMVWLSDLVDYAGENPDGYLGGFSAFDRRVDAEYARAGLVDEASKKWSKRLRVCGAFAFFIGLIVLVLGELVVGAFLAVSGALVWWLGRLTVRSTQLGANIGQLQFRLRQGLDGFVGRNQPAVVNNTKYAIEKVLGKEHVSGDVSDKPSTEPEPGDAVDWEGLLLQAYVLGCSFETADALKRNRPDLFKAQDDQVTWWMLYYPHRGQNGKMASLGKRLEAAIQQGFDRAQAAKETGIPVWARGLRERLFSRNGK